MVSASSSGGKKPVTSSMSSCTIDPASLTVRKVGRLLLLARCAEGVAIVGLVEGFSKLRPKPIAVWNAPGSSLGEKGCSLSSSSCGVYVPEGVVITGRIEGVSLWRGGLGEPSSMGSYLLVSAAVFNADSFLLLNRLRPRSLSVLRCGRFPALELSATSCCWLSSGNGIGCGVD